MPNKNVFLLILVLLILALASAYNYFFKPFKKVISQGVELVETQLASPSPTPLKQIDKNKAMLAELSPAQKVKKLVVTPVNLDKLAVDASAAARLQENQPENILIFGSKISLKEFKNFKEKLTWQPLLLVDHEGGQVQRLSGEGFTALPSWAQFCKLDKKDQIVLLQNSAQELSQVGINIVLAPVIDVGQSVALGSRICSDNQQTVQQAAQEYLAAFKAQNITPVLKHFPGIGLVDPDLHQTFASSLVNQDEADLYRYFLDQDPTSPVLVTHLGVKNQDEAIPCSLSKSCVGELQRNYPETLTIADALDMRAALSSKQNHDLPSVSVAAVSAGAQLLLFSDSVSFQDLAEITGSLEQAYNQNSEFAYKVDQAILRIKKLTK